MDWVKQVTDCCDVLRSDLPEFSSPHEGLGYIQDGISRLQKAVFDRSPNMDLEMAAIEVAAQSLRFLKDLCEPQKGG